jgi:phosphoserine phosphatase
LLGDGGLKLPTPTHRSAREDALSLADGWLQVVSTHHRSPWKDVDRSKPGLELVLLDMDGTLVDGSSWEIVHDAFGVSNQGNWERYQRGELDDLEFMRSDIALWHVGGKKKHVDEVEKILLQAPLMPGARDLVDSLRARGVATCILSGGIDILARHVCEKLGIDMYVANGLKLEESGHLAGEGIVYVEIRDKAKTAREILAKLGVPKERTAGVGNSAYDVPMFRACGYGVAVNPSDPWVRRAARHVVEGKDLRDVIPHLA